MLYSYTDLELGQWSESDTGWDVLFSATREPDGIAAEIEARIPYGAINVEWYSDDEWAATFSLDDVWWTEYVDGLETIPAFEANGATIDAIEGALCGSELVEELAQRVRAFNEEEHALSGLSLDGGA